MFFVMQEATDSKISRPVFAHEDRLKCISKVDEYGGPVLRVGTDDYGQSMTYRYVIREYSGEAEEHQLRRMKAKKAKRKIIQTPTDIRV